MVDTNGNTNTFNAMVGRDGNFWFQCLPLDSGTNLFTLMVTDVVGNITITNLTVVQGDSGLNIDPMSEDQTNVTGEISVKTYTVWVNGVEAALSSTPNGNGVYTWEANNPSVGPNNTLVQVEAIPNTDNGGNGSGNGVWVNPSATDSQNAAATVNSSGIFVDFFSEDYRNVMDQDDVSYLWDLTFFWANDIGGFESGDYLDDPPEYIESDSGNCGASSWPQAPAAGLFTEIYNGITNTSPFTPGPFPFERVSGANFSYVYDFVFPLQQNYNLNYEQTKTTLATGGPPGSTKLRLWELSVSAESQELIPSEDPVVDVPPDSGFANIPPQEIAIGSLGYAGSDGVLWVLLPDNITVDVTPYVKGNDNYSFDQPANPPVYSWNPYVWANQTYDLTVTNPLFCVGQYIDFALEGLPVNSAFFETNFQWGFGGTFVNTNTQSPNPDGCKDYYIENTNFLNLPVAWGWWTSGAYDPPALYFASVNCTMEFANGNPPIPVNANGSFYMHRPSLTNYNPNSFGGAVLHAHAIGASPGIGTDSLTLEQFILYTVNVNSLFGCEAFITQVFNGTFGNQTCSFNTEGSNYLDNSEIYPLSSTTLANSTSNNYVLLVDNALVLVFLTRGSSNNSQTIFVFNLVMESR
jgi:hypothetical protein